MLDAERRNLITAKGDCAAHLAQRLEILAGIRGLGSGTHWWLKYTPENEQPAGRLLPSPEGRRRPLCSCHPMNLLKKTESGAD